MGREERTLQTPPLRVNWNAGPGPRTGGPRRTDAGGGAGHAVGETRGGPRRGVFRAPVSQRRSPRSTATRPVRDLKAFPRDGALWVEWTPPGPPVAKYVLEWCVLSDRAPCLPDWQQEEGSVQRTFLTGTPRARARPSHASCARSSPRLLAACARRPVGVTWGRPGDRPDALPSAPGCVWGQRGRAAVFLGLGVTGRSDEQPQNGTERADRLTPPLLLAGPLPPVGEKLEAARAGRACTGRFSALSPQLGPWRPAQFTALINAAEDDVVGLLKLKVGEWGGAGGRETGWCSGTVGPGGRPAPTPIPTSQQVGGSASSWGC